jgi:hypothetical protein
MGCVRPSAAATVRSRPQLAETHKHVTPGHQREVCGSAEHWPGLQVLFGTPPAGPSLLASWPAALPDWRRRGAGCPSPRRQSSECMLFLMLQLKQALFKSSLCVVISHCKTSLVDGLHCLVEPGSDYIGEVLAGVPVAIRRVCRHRVSVTADVCKREGVNPYTCSRRYNLSINCNQCLGLRPHAVA